MPVQAAQDSTGNTLDAFVGVPFFVTGQDSSGNKLNAILPGPFALASTSGNGFTLSTPSLLDEGEPTGEGAVDGEGIVDGEGALEGEGVTEGTVDGEGSVDGEGVVEGIIEGVADGEGGVDLCEITLSTIGDVTIYNNATFPGEAANGAGQRLFVGTTNTNAARRALLNFNVLAALPADAAILSAELRLTMDKASSNDPVALSLSRLTNSFSEGLTDPLDSGDGSGEGNGAGAAPGDTTWLHRSYDSLFWIAAGGDFASTVSATTFVAGNGEYTWAGDNLVADVQAWLDGGFTEFGWILVGDESAGGTVKRFLSEESATVETRPTLTLTYTSATPCETPEGEGEGTPDAFHSADTDEDGDIDLSEVLRVIQLYNAGRFGCDAQNLEDGFTPGGIDESCAGHDGDYAPRDYIFSLSELLRVIQFYGIGGYAVCGEGEDGFCPQS
jgi:hypothetical protein